MTKLRNNRVIQFSIIQFSFLLISVIFVSGILYTNRIVSSSDSIFNYQRIYEALLQLVHLHIPQYSLNTTIPIGSGIETFYPWLIFAPLALLVLIIHNPIMLWSLIISIYMLIGLEISYFACFKYNHNKRISYLFSVFYCFSNIEIFYAIANSDIGEYVGMFFVPLVFFGWIFWLKADKWKMMTLGLCLILFCHVLTFIITLGSLIILNIVFIDKIKWNKRKFKVLAIALVVTFLSTSVVWLPICELMFHNSIELPKSHILVINNLATVIPNRLSFLMIPWLYKVWTFSDLASIILVAIYWRYIDFICKRLFWISIVYIILNMNPIKDFLISYTPLAKIQFMYRICFFSHILLSFLLANLIVRVLVKKWYIQNVWTVILLLLALMVGSIYLSSAVINIMPKHSTVKFYHIARMKDSTLRDNESKQGLLNKTILSNHIMKHKEFIHYCPNFDYSPVTENHKYLDSKRSLMHKRDIYMLIKKNNNGTLYFYSKKKYRNILMPVVVYHHQNYSIKVNGKSNNYLINKKYKCIEIKKAKKGLNKVQLKPYLMPYRYVSMALTIIGIMFMIMINDKKRDLND